jgi:hypothetical protein
MVFTRHNFEKHELSGSSEIPGKISAGSRVLGIDLVKQSRFIKNRRFLQIFACGQTFKGGEPSSSVAEHSSGIVAYKEKRQIPWTQGLECFADRVKKSDLKHCDNVLLNRGSGIHNKISNREVLINFNKQRAWRLY